MEKQSPEDKVAVKAVLRRYNSILIPWYLKGSNSIIDQYRFSDFCRRW